MLILLVTISLRAPWCSSLKDKRSLVKPLILSLRRSFNASIIESGLQDAHSLAELSVAVLAANKAQADSIAERLYRAVESSTDAEIIGWACEFR
jgi:hypothetical protein